jgi:hypothetical protein
MLDSALNLNQRFSRHTHARELKPPYKLCLPDAARFSHRADVLPYPNYPVLLDFLLAHITRRPAELILVQISLDFIGTASYNGTDISPIAAFIHELPTK